MVPDIVPRGSVPKSPPTPDMRVKTHTTIPEHLMEKIQQTPDEIRNLAQKVLLNLDRGEVTRLIKDRPAIELEVTAIKNHVTVMDVNAALDFIKFVRTL